MVRRKKLPKKAATVLFLIILGAGIVLATPYLNPMGKMSLFSVSQVEIDPQGGEVIDGKLKGCYWVIEMTIDQVDALRGDKLVLIEKGEQGEFNGNTVEAKKSLEIRISPDKAFFYRGVRQQTTTITEDAYRSIHNKLTGAVSYSTATTTHATPLVSSHYIWDESFWKAETKFGVETWLNGVLITPIGGKVMDTHAGETEFTIDTSYGQIAFRSLGGLTGGWEEPDVGPLLIWNENYVYDWDQAYYAIKYDSGGQLVNWKTSNTKVQKLVNHNNPYSVYWFGTMRWAEHTDLVPDDEVRRTPAGYKEPKVGEYVLWCLNSADYGGWISEDDTLNERRNPVKPVVFPEQKDTLPSGKRSFYSVTEWLENVKNIPNRGELGSESNSVFRGYESWVLDEVGKEVRVYMPYNAYEIPMVQILVPAELVDTWVWTPPVANLKIESQGWLEGTGTATEIADGVTRACWVKVRQASTVESTGKVAVSSSTPSASISPSYQKPTLAPGDEATLYFEVTNLGVAFNENGRVQVSCKELLTGSQTDFSNTLSFTLKTAGQQGDTVLDITVVDDETGLPVGGTQVHLSYGGSIKQAITNEKGYTSFNLGSYTGKVVITTKETTDYRQAIRSLDLSSGTHNLVIRLLKQEEDGIPMEYILAGLVVVVLLVAYYYYRR